MQVEKVVARASIVLLVCGALAGAQVLNERPRPGRTAAAAPAEAADDSTPTFRSSSRLVVVDVVVTDRDGNPVTGLNQGDFTVLEDGKLQPIQSFETHLPVQRMTDVPDLHLPPRQPASPPLNPTP